MQFGRLLRCLVVAIAIPANPLLAQYNPNYPEPNSKLRGSLFLHGGGSVTREQREKFVELAGGKNAKLVVIPTADYDEQVKEFQLRIWLEMGADSVEILHADVRDEALRPEFVEPLKSATGVWITGGRQTRLADVYLETDVEQALQDVIRRGGVVGGSSAGAAITSQVMLVRGEARRGFDLLPQTIVDQHFVRRNREERLRNVLAQYPNQVGLGVDEATALIVQGRRLSVLGDSSVTILLAPGGGRPERKEVLTAGQTADWIALHRAAVARQQTTFPQPNPAPPNVPHGSLVIVGGGQTPPGLIERFIELAGGPTATLVYVPCEEAEVIPKEPSILAAFRKAGAKNVHWIHTKDRRRANQDEALLKPLAEARGVWFGGGRQWNLVDSYQHTKVHQLVQEVLTRGGVIAGSSAGASIQGDYMPRGNPLGNQEVMAEGYEQGLGLLTGVAIDQHFSQRNRFADMSSLVEKYPQLLGIGIDESTAIVVQKSEAVVVGKGHVAIFDAQRERTEDDKPYVELSAGARFDLARRKFVAESPTE